MNISDQIRQLFKDKYGTSPALIVRSPGRVNIIGEHTDYNGGLVLPCAIDRYMYLALSPNELREIRMYAADLDEYAIQHIDKLHSLKRGHFANFVLGVYFEMNKIEPITRGFDLVVKGNIPIGAGLSSSAALCCCMAFAMDQALDFNWDRIKLAQIVQRAHHSFAGVNCGMLDQMACLLGKKERAILIDCKNLEYRYIEIPSTPCEWFLIDSGVRHTHVDSAYNKRVAGCQGVLEAAKKIRPGAEVLSDLTRTDLNQIRQKVTAMDYTLASFVLEENRRVQLMIEAMAVGDLDQMGRLLYEGHRGLAEEYQVSCPETDFIVEFSKQVPGVLGARMVGGGFGGCVLCLSRKGDHGRAFYNKLAAAYDKKFGKLPGFMEFQLVDGTEVVFC